MNRSSKWRKLREAIKASPVIIIHSEGFDNPLEAVALFLKFSGIKIDAIYMTRNQMERESDV